MHKKKLLLNKYCNSIKKRIYLLQKVIIWFEKGIIRLKTVRQAYGIFTWDRITYVIEY